MTSSSDKALFDWIKYDRSNKALKQSCVLPCINKIELKSNIGLKSNKEYFYEFPPQKKTQQHTRFPSLKREGVLLQRQLQILHGK